MSKQLIPSQGTILKLEKNGDHHNAVSTWPWESRGECCDCKGGAAPEKKRFVVWPLDGYLSIKTAESQKSSDRQTIMRPLPNV